VAGPLGCGPEPGIVRYGNARSTDFAARLDAMIDKMIKRLIQMKTYKQVTEMQSAATTNIADHRSAPRLVPPETRDRAA
jgi:hypothetical protein